MLPNSLKALLLLLVTTSGLAQAQTPFNPAAAQAVLESAVAEGKLAGMSAAIGKDGAIIWSSGVGFANVESQTPMTASTVHRIASISKPIAAVGAMLLLQDGKLALDHTLRQHVPAWPEAYPPITIAQMLSHTSGIRHYKGVESMSNTHYDTLAEALGAFQADAMIAAPGEKYIYSTYGYTALGAAIEAASGEPLHDLLKRRVWEPAAMAATTFEFLGQEVPNRATGYTQRRGGKLVLPRPTDLSLKYPGGGMLSTAEDLVRFAQAFQADTLLSAETRALMLSPAKLNDGTETGYGLGWNVGGMKDELTSYSHSGGQSGTSTILTVYPEAGVAIAIICNVDEAFEHVGKVNEALRNLALPKP